MSTKISIDPITRLEGHGRIDIFLDDAGDVKNAYLIIPELRGFEKFSEGRPVEELPRITPRICGVCPEAHHFASAKACDAVYKVEIPPAARKLREMEYCAFCAGDHATHFYILGAPDFVMGPDADPAVRNILGVIGKVGLEIAGKVIQQRANAHKVIKMMGGRPTHSINLLPGGMSKPINEEERKEIEEMGKFAVEFGKFSLQLFKDVVLANKAYVDVILSEPYKLDSYYMGLVDENNKVNFYDGKVRVTGPDGKEFVKYAPAEYLDVIAEHVEPYTYLKYPYLKKIGWKGLKDGPDSGMYQATPLSRLNASDGMATPLAQEAYEEFYATLGGKPVKATLAAHWARLVEMLYCGERWLELAQDPEITDPNVRTIPTATPSEGVAIVEAPRGTLTHHYITDEKGIVKKANLIVGTTNNYAAISAVVRNVAKALIKGGKADNATLNMIEMGFRSYDPCFGCATHALGRTPLEIRILDSAGELVERLTQNI